MGVAVIGGLLPLTVGNVCKLDVVVGSKVWFGGLLNTAEFKSSVTVEFISELSDDTLGCNSVDEVLMDTKLELCAVDTLFEELELAGTLSIFKRNDNSNSKNVHIIAFLILPFCLLF